MVRKPTATRRSFSEQEDYVDSNPPAPIITDEVLAQLKGVRQNAQTRTEQIGTILTLANFVLQAGATAGTATGQPWGPVALAVSKLIGPYIERMGQGGLEGYIQSEDPQEFGRMIAETLRLIEQSKEDK